MSKKEHKFSQFEQKMNEWIIDHLTTIPFIEKIFFIDHLRVMIHAGLSLVEALTVLEKESANKKFKKIVSGIKKDVETGQQLSDVLAKFPKVFPQTYVKMIRAGEIAGRMEDSLEQVAIQMKRTRELTSSIRGAMMYPAVILTAMTAIGIMMAVYVLPQLITIFDQYHAKLPLATRILIAITHLIGNPLYLSIILGTIILFITGFIVLLRHSSVFRHAIHTINLYIPIAGHIIKQINLAKFSLTLSSMLESTVPIIDAVQISSETCSNLLYKDSLQEASELIKTGTPLSEILKQYKKLYPPMVTEMIMVGEKSGEINSLLKNLADFYTSEVDKTMMNFTKIIEPVIIIIIGVAVGGLAVAVIMPMYTLVQSF